MAFVRLDIDSLKSVAKGKASALRGGTDLVALADTRDARSRAEQIAEQQALRRRGGEQPEEFGGPKGLEPTRYGDWEKAGRCFDF